MPVLFTSASEYELEVEWAQFFRALNTFKFTTELWSQFLYSNLLFQFWNKFVGYFEKRPPWAHAPVRPGHSWAWAFLMVSLDLGQGLWSPSLILMQQRLIVVLLKWLEREKIFISRKARFFFSSSSLFTPEWASASMNRKKHIWDALLVFLNECQRCQIWTNMKTKA